VAKKILKINTKTKRAHNLRGAAATATGHSRAISPRPVENHYPRPVEDHYPRPVENHYPRPVEDHYPRPVENHYPRPVENHYPRPVENQEINRVC